MLSGFEEEEEYILIKEKYIEKNGGEVLEGGGYKKDEDVDYLVCNYSRGYRQRQSNIDYQKLRTPFWIWLSVSDEWNYSLDWHPFFRPNGNFTSGMLSGFQICLVGYSRTMRGFEDRESSPRYIRKLNDVGILVSFIVAQMGGGVVFEEDYSDETLDGGGEGVVTKLALVCGEETGGDLVRSLKERRGFQKVVGLDWLFDCYDEGRVLNYKKYDYKLGGAERRGELVETEVAKALEMESVCNKYRVVVSHQVYLRRNEVYDVLRGRRSNGEEERVVVEAGRPSREVIKYLEENQQEGEAEASTALVLVFNDSMEEQDFWLDLMNSFEESLVFNVRLMSREKKTQILERLQRMRIINDPDNLFDELPDCVDTIMPLITRLSSMVGYSVPSYMNDLLTSEEGGSGFLDTVLKFTDFENITGLSGFVEYSNDNPMDIVNLNRSKSIKRFETFEKEYSSIKLI